jgi:hypothetical protein
MPPQKKKVDGNDGVTKKKNIRKKRMLPTILTKSSQKDPSEQQPLQQQQQQQQRMPSLCPVKANQTPAPSPPKLLNIPGEIYQDHSDPCHPLDHTNPESPTDLHYYQKLQLPSILMMMTTSSVTICKVYKVLVKRDHSAMTKTTAKTHHTSNQNWRMMTFLFR